MQSTVHDIITRSSRAVASFRFGVLAVMGSHSAIAVRALILITLLATAAVSMLGGSWTAINSGLPGGTKGITGLTLDPAVPSTLYAWTSSGDVFKSMDGAASWKPVGSIGGGVNVLVVDPHKTSTLYAATVYGLSKSTDGGASWQWANSGLAGGPISWLAIDPITSATLYAVTTFGGLFKSTDAGGSWSELNNGLPADGSILSVYLDPKHPSTIYAVGNTMFRYLKPSVGVIFKSTDGGTSWAAMNTVPDATFSGYPDNPLAIDPVNANTIYAAVFTAGTGGAAGYGSIAKSTDGGQSWKAVRAGSAGIPNYTVVRSLALDPTAPSTVYASYADAGGSGVMKSTDGGQSWNIATVVPSTDAFFHAQIAIDPSAPSTIYTAYSDSLTEFGGILKSIDSGQTWNAANAGLSNFNAHLLAIDSRNASTVYASEGNSLFKSADRGASWSNIGSTPQVVYPYAFQGTVIHSMLFTNPDILFVGTAGVGGTCGGDLYKSVDGGVTWSALSPAKSNSFLKPSNFSPSQAGGCDLSHPIVADPTNSTTFYVLANDDVDGAYWLFKSVDGGANWNFAWNGAQGFQSDLNALVIDPSNPAILYAATASGLYKSYDGGASSNNVSFSNSAVTALAIDPSNRLTLYANAVGQGLFKSTDGGASWLAINNGLDALIEARSSVTALVVTPGNSNVLFAATAGLGIYQSIDGGANWNPFNDGLTNLDVRALIVGPGTPSTMYAGTSGGIFEMDYVADPWQLAITALKTAAGTDSYNFWQWDWLWQRTPAFPGAPPSFGVMGSIDNTPGLIEEIIAAGGGSGVQDISAEQWVAYYRQVIATDPWQQALARMQASAGTDSYNLWQWAWFWQRSPTFAGAPAGFGVLGSIDNNPGLRSGIIAAGGGNGLAVVSAEQWLRYYRQAAAQ